MPRHLARGIAGPAMFAILSFQAAAQLPHEVRCVHAWPEAVTVGAMLPELARTCRFDAATGHEVVVLRVHEVGVGAAARDLFVLRDVARSHAGVSLGSAIDFVVVDCGPDAQGVITLGSDGTLRLVRWAAGQAVPAVQTLAVWPGFRRLAAVRNGGTTELFGFDTASVRIRRATWSGTQLSASTLVFAPPGVTFIEGIDWNHDGMLELVVGTPTTMFVQGWNMAPITNIPLPGAAQSATVATCVSHASGAGDRLVTVVSQGGQTAVTWANSTMTGGLLLGPHEIACIATFDREGDGDEDVLLGDADHSVVHVLLREPWGFVPAVAPLIVGPTAPDAGIRALAGGDIDGDADGDFVAFHTGTMKVQTWFGAARSAQRLRGLRVDLRGLVPAPTVQLPVTVQLPDDLSALHPEASSFRLSFDGWLVDPAAATVMPQRALQHEIAVDPGECEHTVTLSLALPPACQAGFHLQLVARVVAVPESGAGHRLPPTLLHVTNQPALAGAILRTVAEELTGDPDANILRGDGGGDGNILGTKTGKHQIGVPPE